MPGTYQNPALQRHYATLQALALDRDDVIVPEDQLVMDSQAVQAVCDNNYRKSDSHVFTASVNYR